MSDVPDSPYAEAMAADRVHRKARRRRRALLGLIVLVVVFAGLAWVWSHGAQQGPRDVTSASDLDRWTMNVDNGGDRRLGETIPVGITLVVSDYGRALTIRPTWPRSPTDPRRCFVPDGFFIGAKFQGRFGFSLDFTANRREADQPWKVQAKYRNGGPRPIVQEQQRPEGLGGDRATPGGPRDCPQWRVELPALAIVSGTLASSGGGGASELDSAAWKAASKVEADEAAAITN